MVLLQISPDAAVTADPSFATPELTMGGVLIIVPIGILLVLVVYLLVERITVINKANQNPEPFMSKVKALVVKGDISGARTLCSQHDTPVARMIEKGISRIGTPLRNIEAAVENVGKIQLFKLEKNLSVLATVAGAAPLLGFLGTTFGVADAFRTSQEDGSIIPELLSAGMYSAMITTIAGLIVGIVAYLAYNYLVTRIRTVIHKMEYTSIDFIDLLQEPRS